MSYIVMAYTKGGRFYLATRTRDRDSARYVAANYARWGYVARTLRHVEVPRG